MPVAASLSKCGMAHPPRSNPPLRFSSGPPGPCITPSTETCVVVVSFMGRPCSRGGLCLAQRYSPDRFADLADASIPPPWLIEPLINRIVIRRMATDGLSLKFAALADPTRRGILARLAQGEATVKELAEPFSVSLPAISRHLKVLERAGLISRRRAAQSRPTRLRVEGLREADEWMDTCQAVWEGRVRRLDAHLDEVMGGGRG